MSAAMMQGAPRGHPDGPYHPVNVMTTGDAEGYIPHTGAAMPLGLSHGAAGMPAAYVAELQDQNTRLTIENRNFKEYADRVGRELRRYIQARPQGPPPAGPGDELPLPPWASNMTMLQPLLAAYEERIAELETVIERSVRISESTKALTSENEKLRTELHDRTDQLRSAQLAASCGTGDMKGEGSDSVQLDELHELYKLAVEQNEMLNQQNQVLKVQLERMRQSGAAVQQQAREAQARVAECAHANKAEQGKTEVLAKQKSAAELRLEEVTGELVEEVRMREQLQFDLERMSNELKLQRQSLDGYKASFEDRCVMARDEEERLAAELQRTQLSEKEHRGRNGALEQEIADISNQLSIARRSGETAQQEAEQMVKLTESMERRLRDTTMDRETIQATLLDQESQVSSLTHERDKLAAAEQTIKKKAERVEARLSADLEALQQQWDQESDSLRTAHERSLADVEERLRRNEHVCSEHLTRADLAEKRHLWEISAVESQRSAHGSERAKLTEDIEEAHQVRLRLERQVSTVQQDVLRLRQDLSAAETQGRESASQAGAEVAAFAARRENIERSLGQAREESHALELRLAQVTSECSRQRSELQDEKNTAHDELEAERRKSQSEKRRLSQQLQTEKGRHQQDKQRACELLQAHDRLRHKWQSEFDVERQALEGQVERLSIENRAIREKSRSALKLAMQRLAASAGSELDDCAFAASA